MNIGICHQTGHPIINPWHMNSWVPTSHERLYHLGTCSEEIQSQPVRGRRWSVGFMDEFSWDLSGWWFQTSRGLNTFQLVRPSQLSVDGYVPCFRHGTDPGDMSGLGRCGLCFLPWKSLASDSSNWQPGQVQWTFGRGSWLSNTDWCGGGATVPGSCQCLWSQHHGAPSCSAIVGELVQTDWCL